MAIRGSAIRRVPLVTSPLARVCTASDISTTRTTAPDAPLPHHVADRRQHLPTRPSGASPGARCADRLGFLRPRLRMPPIARTDE